MSGEPLTSVWTYVAVGMALLLLAGLSTGLALIDLHGWNTVAAFAIAGVKAGLILLFFMRLRYGPGLVQLIALGGITWLGILLGGTLDDVLTRGWLPVPGK
ncbi:MAG TPA: cytochrome C oxidase subunit IV family protein [Chloroflexota bacterium]|jgi:caa(3)-type oxidase subunit IV|nr:cytochrome C oxidase subunit IV family protein [Chloroflexota bacterium]